MLRKLKKDISKQLLVIVILFLKFLFKYSSVNQNVEKESGGDALNITTMMRFQKTGDGVVKVEQNINVEKTRSRDLIEVRIPFF